MSLPAAMAECDRQLEQFLQQREDRSQGASLPKEVRKGRLVKRKEINQRSPCVLSCFASRVRTSPKSTASMS